MKLNKTTYNNIEWKTIFISGLICSLLPLLSDISNILILLSFGTNIPILYIGIRYDITHSLLSSTLSVIITLILTTKENILLFSIFNILPSLLIIYFHTYNINNNKYILSKLENIKDEDNTQLIILILIIYGIIIGIISSFLFNKTTSDMQYITENFIKQNGIHATYIKNWISCIPGIFCIGIIGNNIVNIIITQNILLYTKKIKKHIINIEKFKTPDFFLLLLTISFIGSFFSNGILEIISKTSLCIFILPYIIFSLASLHLIAENTNNKKYLILFITYSFIILLIWPLLIMIIASIFEPWIKLRKWINNKNKRIK